MDAELGDASRFDVVCFGETMASFVATDDPHRYEAIAAGAESNVAIGLARLGCSTRWVSRLGDDPLGRMIEASIASAGVEVSVVRHTGYATGVMVKQPTGSGKVSSYYRGQSAARLLGPGDRERLGRARWIHASGITPALSSSAYDLVRSIVEDPSPIADSVSFDVNLRLPLWSDVDTAAAVIMPLARRADLVFIGEDEALSLLGTADPHEIAEELLIDDSRTVVVKHGARGATAILGSDDVFVPGRPIEAIDETGAGDAFAAGYLAGTCFEWTTEACLCLGHELAVRVIRQTDDAVGPIPQSERDAFTPELLAERWTSPGDEHTPPAGGATGITSVDAGRAGR